MYKTIRIIVSLLVLISLFSCAQEENTEKENIQKESISKKWIVQNSTEFQSVEFDKNGNYIIIKNEISKTSKKNAEIFVFGTYEVLDTDILLLSNFGSMKFDDSDPSNIKFSIKYEGSDTYTYELKVVKAAEFTSTPKTDLLCDNTWKRIKKEPIQDTVSLVNFSKAGTCFTNFSITSQNKGSYLEFGKWQWKDAGETKIIITQLKYPLWVLDKDGEVELEISNLNSTKLEMREVFDGKTYDVAFDVFK
ncbi:hypothetical protein [Flavobacterium sp. UBA7680]|uniref:hypothetical protein n=1 Tax=Flavobacterium sp. UBA7680 TaxID=1946559 RepID=UPI0025C10342|nr:hypothetical protein [Flavobacterium sp. UBA7680]